MEDRRIQKKKRGIEQYKSFYPPISVEERERMIVAVMSQCSECRQSASDCIEIVTNEQSWGAFAHEIGLNCRVCNQPCRYHVFGRPYCDAHYMRALHGKIGKVHGGYVAQ